jgi:5-methylcytosine-specific restriction endonuclease McrA
MLTLTCANADCGREFTRYAAAVRNDHPCCSLSCASKLAIRLGLMPHMVAKTPGDRAQRHLVKSRARRLRRAQGWDGISDAEILERDGWRCQIPGCKRRPIRKDLKYPQPRSKSIDHIVPLSQGGGDTAANKRAAHLGCNVARNNRGGMDQLAMIG